MSHRNQEQDDKSVSKSMESTSIDALTLLDLAKTASRDKRRREEEEGSCMEQTRSSKSEINSRNIDRDSNVAPVKTLNRVGFRSEEREDILKEEDYSIMRNGQREGGKNRNGVDWNDMISKGSSKIGSKSVSLRSYRSADDVYHRNRSSYGRQGHRYSGSSNIAREQQKRLEQNSYKNVKRPQHATIRRYHSSPKQQLQEKSSKNIHVPRNVVIRRHHSDMKPSISNNSNNEEDIIEDRRSELVRSKLARFNDSLLVDSYIQCHRDRKTGFAFPLDFATGVAARHHVLLPCISAALSSGVATEQVCLSVLKHLFQGNLFVEQILLDDSNSRNSVGKQELDLRLIPVPATISLCDAMDGVTLHNWYTFGNDKYLRYSSKEWSNFWLEKSKTPDVDCEMIKLVTHSGNSSTREILGAAYIERRVTDRYSLSNSAKHGQKITLLRGIRVSPSCNLEAKRRATFQSNIKDNDEDAMIAHMLPEYRKVGETLLCAVIMRSLFYGTVGIGINATKDETIENFYATFMGKPVGCGEDGRQYFRLNGPSRWKIIRELFERQLIFRKKYEAITIANRSRNRRVSALPDEM